MLKKIISVSAIVLMLTACQTNPDGQSSNVGVNKEGIGTILGGIGGAVIGSQVGHGAGRVAAVAGGALLGGMLGNQIGASLDRADMAYYNRSSQTALETARSGQSVEWRNPDSGHYGTITPTNTYKADNGDYCREYTQNIVVGGKASKGYGKACRQPDGTWQIVQ